MTEIDPITLFYGGAAKLAPGGDEHTRHVLGLIPEGEFSTVIDVGCGNGRQTVVLARELGATVHALDTHAPFLEELKERARVAGLSDRVVTHDLDMSKLGASFSSIDLLWSEGAIYNLGFGPGLKTWAPSVAPGGFVVVSEITWLTEERPARVAEFWSVYPTMQDVEGNLADARAAGFEVIATYTLPPESWTEDFYDVFGPRAQGLLDHPEEAVRALAREMVEEIEIFEASEGSYGYVFYVLRRPE